MLIVQHHLVTFLDLEVQSKQNIGWPIRVKKLHNRMNELEGERKADNLKLFYYKFSQKLSKSINLITHD